MRALTTGQGGGQAFGGDRFMAVGSAGSEIRGLIVKPYWLDKIRGSSKAWEIRGSPTQKR